MKLVAPVAALALISLGVVGCNHNKKPAETNPAVTELTPPPQPTVQPAPVVVTPAPAEVAPAAPAHEAPLKEAPAASAHSKTPISGHKYVVQSGDTLYNIAVRKYGKGTQANISKIEKANPGLSPNSLRVGKSITLP